MVADYALSYLLAVRHREGTFRSISVISRISRAASLCHRYVRYFEDIRRTSTLENLHYPATRHVCVWFSLQTDILN